MRTKKNGLVDKAPIAMRFKELGDGRKSIYLDKYENGKRHYEFLKLYLVPEDTATAKKKNAKTIREAETILKERVETLYINKVNPSVLESPKHMLLQEWFQKCHEQQVKRGNKNTHKLTDMAKIMAMYNPNVRLDEVDREFCIDFINYLRTEYKTKKGQNIALITAWTHCAAFRMTLNEAVRQGVLSESPWNKLEATDKIREPESKREYLTISEVKKLADTPFVYEYVRQIFLFACFTGIRPVDIERLKWKDIFSDGEQARMSLVQEKTGEALYIPLSKQAQKWLPERGQSDEIVFKEIKNRYRVNEHLKIWAATAGITKDVTLYTARHTFATMMIALGADIYTISKLLGHTSVHNTQIYAKMLDEKKDKAVNLTDGMEWHGKNGIAPSI